MILIKTNISANTLEEFKMDTLHKIWTIRDLSESVSKIEFPEFQREPTVWKLDKKQKLIDSILRGFDISSIYLYKKEKGGYDCIDGRQRINAIWSFLGINLADEDHNGFNLKIENEIYDDEGKFSEIDTLRFERLEKHESEQIKKWAQVIMEYKLNVVETTKVKNEEELNLLFLRLQIASILNAGEKLNAMTGDIRNSIFNDISKHDFFKKIAVPNRRFVKEQIAAQIALNEFSKRDENSFHRSRYVDLQDFFKTYNKFNQEDKKTINKIKEKLDKIDQIYDKKLSHIDNRAMAVSVYLFISQLIEDNNEDQIKDFIQFFEEFLKTLKWQLPLGVNMDPEYHELLRFQTNVTQAAGEKSAIERRHEFLGEWFYYYREHKEIKGDDKYRENHDRKNPDNERDRVRFK